MNITTELWSTGDKRYGGNTYKKVFVRDSNGSLVAFALCENEDEYKATVAEFSVDFTE